MFKGISGLTITKQLALAALAFVAFLFIAMFFTSWFTRHGESIKVPKVIGMPVDNANSLLDDNNLEMVIVDSVYKEDMPAMTVVEQDPKFEASVKPGRKIYVTVNTGLKPKVKVPKLVNGGANLAKVLLQNAGLKLGKIDSVASPIGSGLVLAQKYRGKPIAPNTMLDKGSVIDIVVSKKMSVKDTSGNQDVQGIINTDPLLP
ncbi:MAG: PASTA domain-containing protein [Bacteroidetes bacterium]|nr:PASTA domain-containing protein [Bacteroidota bacterium]